MTSAIIAIVSLFWMLNLNKDYRMPPDTTSILLPVFCERTFQRLVWEWDKYRTTFIITLLWAFNIEEINETPWWNIYNADTVYLYQEIEAELPYQTCF